MKSVVMLYVEHGETTDPLTQLIDDSFFVRGANVYNYEVKCDVTEEEAESALAFFRPA